jgi:PadR family transcriptional regulator PadR
VVPIDPSNLRKGVVEYCALALMRDDDEYGRTIGFELASRNLLASEGSIYPLLSRMRTNGLVYTRWEESTAGPPRRYYGLTPAGAQALENFESLWSTFAQNVSSVLAGRSAPQ